MPPKSPAAKAKKLAYVRDYCRAMRAAKRAAGLCVHSGCGEPGEVHGGRVLCRCKAHRVYQKKYHRDYHAIWVSRKKKMARTSTGVVREPFPPVARNPR